MSKVLKERILSNENIADEIYKMAIESEYVSINAFPGQFVNIKCGESSNTLLRRPISICRIDRKNKTFDIVYQVRGAGTEYMSKMPKDTVIDMIAPLGNKFEIKDEYKSIAVVGGGIGVFPLLSILEEYKTASKAAYLGFRNKNSIVLEEEFNAASDKLCISTDDGSEGYKGLVTDLLIKDLKENKYDVVYTCGPTPMIKKVAGIAKENGVKCQVSLEERMGCGIGACLVCACKTKLGDQWEYSHVCKDGPVFWSEEVVFE